MRGAGAGFVSIWVWAAIGCNGNKDFVLPATGDTGSSTVDTTPIPMDEASVAVLAWLPSFDDPTPDSYFAALFVESRKGWLNLAQCVSSAQSFCTTELPNNPGDSVVVSTKPDNLARDLESREVGNNVTLGDWSGEIQYSSEDDLTYYYDTWHTEDLPNGALGLGIPGRDNWPAYAGADDITAPVDLEVLSPDPLELLDFFDGQPIHLAWVPEPGSDLFLFVRTPPEQRLFRLEDNGAFDLDLSPLTLADGAEVDLILMRWAHTTVNVEGRAVDVEVQSNQPLRGSWRSHGSRTEFTGADDECAAAEVAPSAVPGNYYGDLRGATADLNPGASGCTGFAATGIDRVVPIDLLPEDLLTVNYQLVNNDASLYLLTDCDAVESCLAGSDSSAMAGGVETITWFNDTGSPLRVYAVLDAFGAVNDLYNLDIYIDSLGGEILVPTCVDAIAQGPAISGSYHGSIAGYADLLEPKCAAPATGAEGMTQVLLQAGERLTATVDTPAGNPKLYVLSNCAIGDSCVLADDTDAGNTETLIYENPGPSSAYLYLVLDGDTNLDEYFLDLEIQ